MTLDELRACNSIDVEVTQDDIDKGTRRSCSECPIARAFERTTGLFASVKLFGGIMVTYYGTGPAVILRHCAEAISFIKDFDEGMKVKPCTLTFTVKK